MFWFRLCLAIAGVASVIAGLRLVRENGGPSWPGSLSDWLLKQKISELCSRTWKVERFVYRHHRLFGSAITAGALTLLGVLYSWHKHLPVLPAKPLGAGMPMAEFAAWTIVGAVLLVGMTMLIRPSALKSVENLSNRWIALPLLKLRTTRQTGILLMLAGLACIGAAASMVGA